MKRICAWCNRLIGSVKTPGIDDKIETHCICADCATNPEFQLGVPLEKYLNSLPAPVVLVDADVRVIVANRKALDLVNAEAKDLPGQLLGNVFECAFARLPGGCGKSIHCSGCAIRNSVNHTVATGEPLERVAALLRKSTSDPMQSIELTISTKKVGKMVLLSIDSISAE